jgi:nicotinate-nucleotide--dimethylbenzimidazole phosphoribosyltransferase
VDLEARIAALVAGVPAVDDAAAAEARTLHQQLAKPRGSLGRIEDVGVQLAAIAGSCPPPAVRRPEVVVCAGTTECSHEACRRGPRRSRR